MYTPSRPPQRADEREIVPPLPPKSRSASEAAIGRAANVRERALQILYRVETGKAYATRLLQQVDAAERDGDHAFLEQLVKGTLDWRGAIDDVLDPVVKGGIAGLTPWVRNILRLGVYQILYLDRVPAEVAVNEAVESTKRHGHRGTVGLVNAVLRTVVRQARAGALPDLRAGTLDDPLAIATVYSHPLWIVQRWIAQIGVEETIALCAADNQAWPLCLRTNTARMTTDTLRAALHEQGVRWHPASFHPDCTIVEALPSGMRLHGLPAYREGLFVVQDESSAFIGLLVDPQPGEVVVDLCSAPGGKTTHLAMLMQNQGRIVAVDTHAARLHLVEETCARLGLTIVEGLCSDGRSLVLDGLADRVLVDAPCSGLGVLGRRSDARWNRSEESLAPLRVLQQELLTHAATLVRPGGRLVYSTCTVDSAENEGTVAAFLRTHPTYALQPATADLPAALVDDDGYYRTWPQRHKMGGAFGAVLVRNA